MKTHILLGSILILVGLVSCSSSQQPVSQQVSPVPQTPPPPPESPVPIAPQSAEPAIKEPVQKMVASQTKASVQTAVSNYFQGQNVSLPADQEWMTQYVDLNDDGQEDALVVLTGPEWCGTGGCTLLVVAKEANGFRVVSKSTLIQTPLVVSETRTNGWRDLIVEVRGNGMVALKFDGKGYPSNPSTQPALGAKVQVKGVKGFPEGSTEAQPMNR
jgi:hypothetical protein